MVEMERSRTETEIKLRFESPEAALRCLDGLGGRLIQPREFEDNIVYDRDGNPLKAAGRLLRLRRSGQTALLTYKAPVAGDHRHKVRQEEETVVEDPVAVEAMLEGLGFHPIYRYQKYRTLFEVGDLHVCLDETPLGCYVELEGPPDQIDRAAEVMGISRERYVLETYRELQEKNAMEHGIEAGDLVFDPPAEDGS
jgi:adenylate cyclase class 2